MAWLDPLLAVLLLLPAAWLAYPATLSGQLEPEVGATGWWVLLQLAAALVLLFRKPRAGSPQLTLYASFVALSMISLRVLSPSDTLSASRSVLIAIASLSAMCAGSALGPQGRRVFCIGLVLLSIGLSAPALAGVSPRFQGALQNSGATSEAALLGALAALAWWLHSDKRVRALALIAIGAYGVFVARAPVIAGALIFVCIAVLVWFFRRGDRRKVAVSLGAFTLAAIAAFVYTRASAPAPEAAPSAASTSSPAVERGHFGGVAVRLAIAPRALAMFADKPWFGVGPGQFRACFPPYRAESERTASNRAEAPGRESEVEHAHNDFLTTLDETGLIGGLLWTLTLVWLVICALRELKSAEFARVALALAVLGGVMNALMRAPLTFNPASASLFFASAGGLIASDSDIPAGSRVRRWIPLFALALLALQVPRALNFVRHDNALRLPGTFDPPAALAACPDSPMALSFSARKLAADPARIAQAQVLWERVLALRPFNFEALVQAGVLAANDHKTSSARSLWQRALDIAPEGTKVLRSLLLLEARSGEDDDFERAAQRARGQVARAWAIDAGANELLAGDDRAAMRLWKFASADWTQESAQELYDRSRVHEEEPSRLKTAWEMLAHLRWARELAAQNDFAASVRSYRQALRLAAEASSVRLELAAALWSDGKQDEARAEIERAKADPEDWKMIASWAAAVLLKAGLFPTH